MQAISVRIQPKKILACADHFDVLECVESSDSTWNPCKAAHVRAWSCLQMCIAIAHSMNLKEEEAIRIVWPCCGFNFTEQFGEPDTAIAAISANEIQHDLFQVRKWVQINKATYINVDVLRHIQIRLSLSCLSLLCCAWVRTSVSCTAEVIFQRSCVHTIIAFFKASFFRVAHCARDVWAYLIFLRAYWYTTSSDCTNKTYRFLEIFCPQSKYLFWTVTASCVISIMLLCAIMLLCTWWLSHEQVCKGVLRLLHGKKICLQLFHVITWAVTGRPWVWC